MHVPRKTGISAGQFREARQVVSKSAKYIAGIAENGRGVVREASDIWTENLTDAQLRMVTASGHDPKDGRGFGVELRGAGDWATARNLQRIGVGWIEGGAPNGSELPGLYFNNTEGVRIVNEFADDDEGCPVCGCGHGDPNHTHWIPA